MDVSEELEDDVVESETENNEALTLWRPWLQPSSSPPVEKRRLGARYAAPQKTYKGEHSYVRVVLYKSSAGKQVDCSCTQVETYC